MLFSSYPKLGHFTVKYVALQYCNPIVCLTSILRGHFSGFFEAKAFNMGDQVMTGTAVYTPWPSVNQASTGPSSSLPGANFN